MPVIVPEVRFSTFKDSWFETSLKEICKIERGRFSPRPRNDPKFYGGEIPFVQTGDVTNSNGSIATYTQTLNEEGLKVSKFFPQGTILITIAANIGYCGVLRVGMACPDSLIGLTPNKKNNNEFLCILLNRLRGRIDYLAPQAAQKNINIEFLAPFKLKVPCIQEQQKIADFLSSVDKKISLLKEKHALLEQYKKGVLQKLFSQKIRFKDENGKDFSDWQELRLNQIATPIKRRLKQAIDTVLTISAKKGFLLQADRFSQIIAGNSLEKYTHLKRGEFSYNRGNSKTYTYGCIYKLDNHEEALVPNIYRSFTLNRGCPEFFAQLFKNKYLDRQLRRLISSSARMDGLLNIGEKDFYEVNVPFPSEDEQKKIGTFLNELDKKLQLVTQQIEQTQSFKKGLLQQMFV